MACVACRTYLDVAQKQEERSNDERLQRGSNKTRAIGHHIAPLTDQRSLYQKSVLSVSGASERGGQTHSHRYDTHDTRQSRR
jgi:hypothetical protein